MNNKSAFFEKCLKKQKIYFFSRGKSLAPKELNLASADLNRAKETFNDEDYKWATIQAYYSMFHSPRALLYYKNYREKSHACLIEAIKVLYVSKGDLDFWLVEAMQEAKRLREEADYYGDFSRINAQKLLEKAEEFLSKAKNIFKNANRNKNGK